MDEQISFGINGDVKIDGKKSIDDIAKSLDAAIRKFDEMKKHANETSSALANIYKNVPTQKLSKSEQSDINSFAGRYANEIARVQHNRNQHLSSTGLFAKADMFRNAYAAEMGLDPSKSLNSKLEKRVQDIIKQNKKTVQDYLFEFKAGISKSELSKMSNDIDKFDKFLSAQLSEHHKQYVDNFRKTTESLYHKYDTTAKDKYYKQQHDKRVKDRYYREQHNERYNRWENSSNTGSWYTNETGFIMGPNKEPYGEGQQLAEKIHQAQRERAEAEQRAAEQTREHFRKVSEQSRLLLTADAGIKKAKEENLTSEKELAEEKEQQVNAEKKNTKKAKEMTAYQNAKIDVANKENEIRQDRNNILRADVERKSAKDNSGYQQFKNAHPELFAVGALYHSKKYQAGHAFQTLGGITSSLGPGGRAVGLALDSLGAFFKAVPFGIATTITNLAKGITELGKASVQAYAEIEAIKTQLGVVFSNQTQADAMFGNIAQYAVKSPFGVQQTSELAVLLKQSGVYASDLMDTLKMLGDTAGGNMEKMKRIANNYAQIVSIGKASMLDMRQFAYAGIPIFEAVSKELGVSQQELRKLISDGKVTADIVEKVFKDLTGINGIFENATEKGAKTLKARLQNLSDARQLALGEVGQAIVGIDERNGNDSFVNSVVETAENIYQWLHDNVNTTNIEHDVQIIANRKARTEELSSLMTSFENNPLMKSLVGIALDAEQTLHDIDYERNVYNQSYEDKMKGHNQAVERFGITNLEEAEEFLEVINYLTNSFNRFNNPGIADPDAYEGFWNSGLGTKGPKRAQELAYKYGLDIEFLMNTTKEETKAIREAATALVQALSDYSKVTEEETKAHRESTIINAQQLAFDQASRASGAKDSYSKGFEDLYGLYTSSDEYKQEQQKKQIEFLKESQKVLKELVSYADKEGNLDISKLSYSKLSEYLNPNKRVLDEGSKLTVVEGKSEAKMTEDRKLLSSQWTKVSEDVLSNLKSKGLYSAADQLQAAKDAYSLDGDNKSFFNNFNIILEQQLGILKELENAESNTAKKEEYQAMSRALLASTFKYTVNAKGLNANPEDLGTNKNEFIPLWKRILAGATGLTTQGMTGTQSTMENYRDDMAIRNMTAGVLSASLKSMGVETAMELVKTSGNAKILKDDTGYTYQVDWRKTQESIKKFSLQLSAATEVVSAYKKGLEDELDVYEQLIVAGYTEAESQDLKNQKTVSTKKLAQLSGDAGDQLVNAFGEILTTKSGKQYKASDVTIQDGRIFDKLGNEIEEEVILTGKLFEFIKSEMPKLRDKIFEATEAELNNKLLNNLFNNVAGNAYMNDYMQKVGYGNSAALMLQHPEYIQEYIDSYLTTRKNAKNGEGELINPNLAKLSNADIYLRSLEASPEKIAQIKEDLENSEDSLEKEALQEELEDLEGASKLVTNAFAAMGVNIGKITNDDKFAALMALTGSQDRDLAVNNALLGFTAYSKNHLLTREGNTVSAGTALRPEDYSGWRGSRNRLAKYGFGINQQYDIEDLYIKAARTSNIAGKNVNQFGIDSTKYTAMTDEGIFKMSDEEILKNLTEQEKEWIKIVKLQKDSATTLNSIADNMTGMLGAFVGDAITSTFNEWGSALAKGEDASSALTKNMMSLSASLMSNLGSMVTQAGLSLAVSSIGDKAGVIAGLAIAAAGGGMSFLGGYLNGALSGNSDKDENKELEKLLKIKQDLADLLKQAREDAIYYENTTRHKKAISANAEFTTRSVHDAVITPKGEVITTDPKDYLIATKTPKTLVGGGAPTINFSVVDKSTGIRVTQQKSTYNKETNSIDFEAVIESKVQEVIASSKGDDAFAAREARLRGHTVIA